LHQPATLKERLVRFHPIVAEEIAARPESENDAELLTNVGRRMVRDISVNDVLAATVQQDRSAATEALRHDDLVVGDHVLTAVPHKDGARVESSPSTRRP
jgi:hypothetical protein